jgi:DNA (cytosine-5)-methyltransferase 1
MGYPETFKIVVSDTQAYRQFGNSVVVPVVERIAKQVIESLKRPVDFRPDLVLMETNDKCPVVPKSLKNSVRYKAQRTKR